MILQVEPIFKLKWVRLKTEDFDLFRQKTLRPKLTQAEGFVLGVGAKMFTIAGPVMVYAYPPQ